MKKFDCKACKKEELFLALKNAEVLFAYQTRVYLRDSTGAITFNNIGVSLKRNDRLNGQVYGKLTFLNNVAQFSPVADYTNVDGVVVIGGDEVGGKDDEAAAHRDLAAVFVINFQHEHRVRRPLHGVGVPGKAVFPQGRAGKGKQQRHNRQPKRLSP